MRTAARKVLLLICLGTFAVSPTRGGDSSDGKTTTDGNASPVAAVEPEPEYKNWIELGIGGLITHGDTAQFNQEHRISGDIFGGIQDMHYEQSVGEKGTLTVDGHAIWDNNDYDIKVDLSKPDLGYIRGGFTEFRSWYDGNGGFFPHHDVWFQPPFPEMHIDRGEAWVELGLRVPDWPEITLRYSHIFRDGQKDSTIWGDTNLTGLTVNPARKIVPAFRDIDETRDIFAADILKTFGNTDVELGMRYERNINDDRLELERGAGQLPPRVAPPGAQRFITQHEKDDIDLFSGHAITETHFSDSLWFTAGYSYTTLGSDLAGTRIFGSHYDAGFNEPILTLRPFDEGFLNLAGTADIRTHVFNANVLWMPLKDVTVLAAFRYTREDREASSVFLSTDTEANVPPFTPGNPSGGFHQLMPEPSFSDTSGDLNRFGQRLELRYTGIVNWVFYAQGDWEEENGHVFERTRGGLAEPLVDRDTALLTQKYTVGANWYPMMRLNLAAQYYHKIADYDNDINEGAHQRLLGQDWGTDDVNVRLTCQPKIPNCLGTLSLVSRYDFMRSTIDGKFFVEGEVLDEQRSGEITKHVFTESITWNPMARLYLQTDVSVVLDQTTTPASSIVLTPNTTPTILNFRNDYWTVSAGAGYSIDQKTDVRADYSFYRANDYLNNARVSMPYGMGASEHTISATASRQITKNMRLLVKYSYFTYADQTSGNHNNYEAHSIYSGLQFRF